MRSPQKRITEISALLEAQAKLDEDYKHAIENGDNAYKAKDYQSSKFEYAAALKLKPDEAYPKDKLTEIEGLLAEQAKKDEQYNNAVKAGDDALAASGFEEAKKAYTEASALKPEESYPKEQLNLVEKKIIELANLNKEYDAAIASADQMRDQKKLEEAKSGYEKALELKPSEAYPKEQITAISTMLAEAKKKDEEYQKLIAEGDKAFGVKDYNGAKTSYSSATALKPDETYPKEKLQEIEKALAEQAQIQEQYDQAIAKADEAFKAGKLKEALPFYQEAAGLKEGESYPVQQISVIDQKLKEAEALDASYADAISKAEGAEKSGDLPVALASFKEASKLKPQETYPQEKISELTDLIAENTKRDESYNEAVKLGDEALKGGEYDIAITQFKKAQGIKPDETYPGEKIAEAEKLKADKMVAIELANKQKAEYDALIKEADGMFDSKNYAGAKDRYVAALDIKPEETYPKTKISEIDDQLANEAEKKARDEKYAALIATADKAFTGKDWDAARSSYKEAQGVKPAETYPGERLKAIDEAVAAAAALADQAAKEAAEKKRQEEYDNLVSQGDDAFRAEDWETARTAYTGARDVKPDETYPTERLKAIDDAIAAAASLADQAAKEAAERKRQEEYNDLVSQGDAAFKAEDWETARTAYKGAKSVKPEETYPTERLKAIDDAIASAAALADQAAKEAAERERQAKYDQFIADGDAAFASKNWESAKSAYNSALSVKSSETYPASQLKAIDEAMASEAAVAAQQEKEAAQREKEARYLSMIAEADAAFKAEDWETARASYSGAKSIKPSETYPDDQLKAIDAAIAAAAALADKEAQEAARREKEAKYQKALTAADQAFRAEEWNDAKAAYQEALAVKPGETYPQSQIDIIATKVAAGAEEARRKEYDAYISTADRAFKDKDWASARSNYQSAQGILPDESYPANQLARIAEAQNKEEAMALQNETDEKYRQIIGDADQLYNTEDWNASRSKYQEALAVKPGEVYPQNRIAQIDSRLKAMEAEKSNLDEQYSNLISQADNAFSSESYTDARSAYQQALTLKANENYPKQRIREIESILKERDAALAANKEEEQKRADYDKYVSKGDAGFSARDYQNAKQNYQSALALLPDEKYPAKKISEIENLLRAQASATEKPKARASSGMSEDAVAAMMLKWQQERDQAKVDRMNQYQSDLKEASDERISDSEDRRLEANDDLDNLELTLRESNKAGAERNLEEAALLEEYRDDLQDFTQDKVEESEKNRNDVYGDLEENQEGQRKMKEDGNRLYQVNTERMVTEKIEFQDQNRENQKEENKKLENAHGDIVDLESDIRDDKEKNMDRYMEDVGRIQRDNELVATTLNDWNRDQGKRRGDNYDDLADLEDNIREFKEDNKESYKNNTQTYWKMVDEMNSYAESKNKESLNRRNKAYNDIVDYSNEVAEVTQEKNNKYLERSQDILRDAQAISDHNAQLAANAEEKRMAFDRNFYQGEDLPRFPDKASQYPQGVTEESFEEGDAYVIKRIVVRGEDYNEYQKIYYKWGGIFYKKNGESTTEVIWNNETK